MKVILITTDQLYSCGIRSISSYLKINGFDVELIFMHSFSNYYSDDILSKLGRIIAGADLIGLSCMSNSSKKILQIADYLKIMNVPIIWGGVHATLNPEECIKKVDYVCVGEGEEALLDLVISLRDNKIDDTILNIWKNDKKNDKIIRNDIRPLIQNLDVLPFLDYDYDYHWILYDGDLIRFRKEFFFDDTVASYNRNVRQFLFLASRGCPYSCSYCCNYELKFLYAGQRYVRKQSVKRSMSELENLKKRLNFTSVWFADDDFCFRSYAEINYFSKEYKKMINLPFTCYSTPTSVDDRKIKILVDAGLTRIEVGIQSGSERVNQELYNRMITNDSVKKASLILNKYHNKLLAQYEIIFANPYETTEDLMATILLLKTLAKPYYLQPYSLVFFPGSKIYNQAKIDGVKCDESLDYAEFSSSLSMRRKQVDLYLNYIIRLMCGRVTNGWYGSIPSCVLNWLISERMLKLSVIWSFIIKCFVNFMSKYSSKNRLTNKIDLFMWKFNFMIMRSIISRR